MEILNLEIKKQFFDNLNERQKRQYAAIETSNLGYGGQLAISEAFEIAQKTINKGSQELLSKDTIPKGRIRKLGGGRKKKSKRT